MKSLKRTWFAVVITIMLSLLTTCGGGNGGGTVPSKPIYTVGGTVTGLSGTLVLQNNRSNDLTLTANVPFSFTTAMADGSTYKVTVYRQPTGQDCTITNDSGTIRSTNVTNVLVVCTTTNTGGVTLSGRIAVPPGVMADTSVNDWNENYVSNETFGTAQILPNPVSVGGYVNMPGRGATGRLHNYFTTLGIYGNPDDVYRVQLKAGDVITLAIGEINTFFNDLDLWLFDGNGNFVDLSAGTGPYEILTAPSDGTYFVNVSAYSGASNYILTIGTDMTVWENAVADAEILSSQREMVPGQVVVRFKAGAKTVSSNQVFAQYAADMGLTGAAGSSEQEMLLTVDNLKFQAYVNKADDALQKPRMQKTVGDPEKARLLNTLLAIKELRKQPDILLAEPNYIVRSFDTVPNDPGYELQWNLPLIGLPEAWDKTRGSDGVIVAVVDSGVLLDHPDLHGRLTNTGYNFVRDANDELNTSPNDPGDKDPDVPGSNSSSFHGTHVAGIIAAETNNGRGVAGVTWETKIMPVRVMGVGGRGNIFDVRQGIRYAAGMDNESGQLPARHADIINLSLGGSGYSRIDQDLINEVREKGVIVIAAAGNENTSLPSYPASYNGVISVSAVNKDKTKASYSNYGPRISMAAPGGAGGANGIYSTVGDDSGGSVEYVYKYMSGTSMAAPHVAGVAALMKAVYTDLSPEDFDALLVRGSITDDIGAVGRDDYYGYGLINASKAVAAAQNLAAGGSTAGLEANPGAINLGVFGSSATVNVYKIGTGELSVNDIKDESSTGWLSVTRDHVNDGESVNYKLLVDRSNPGLREDGSYTAVVTFTASSGISTSVRVTVQVRTAGISHDVGYHYVLLVGTDNNGSLITDLYEVKASNGYYDYVFYNVPPGRYMIAAGTDRNNDTYIDDWCESFGAYPALDQIELIEVADKDISGLNFTTNFIDPLIHPYSTTAGIWDNSPVAELPGIKRLR